MSIGVVKCLLAMHEVLGVAGRLAVYVCVSAFFGTVCMTWCG